MTSRSRWWFLVALLVLFVTRLGFSGLVYERPNLSIANDSDRYIPIANAILSGRAYAWDRERPGELLNTIGYPLFLAGVFLSLGRQIGNIALAQLLLSGMLALVVFGALGRWLGARAAFLSAILILIDPLTILWSMTILTETLFAVALGTSAVLLASWAHSHRRIMLILSGLFLTLAILVKPFAMLVAAVWGAAILFMPLEMTGPRAPRFWGGIRRGLLFALPSILLVAPWFVRNGVLWDCPTLSSVDRVTMRDYMAAKVLAEAEHVDLSVAQTRLQEDDPGPCPSETSKYWKIILDHPEIYARLHAAGTIPVLIGTNFDRWLQYFGAEYQLPDLWRPYMDGGWRGLWSVITDQVEAFPQELGLLVGLTTFQVFIYILAVTGIVTTIRGTSVPGKWVAAVMTLAILILVLTPGQGGHERFRVPVQPLLAILAGYGVAYRWRAEDHAR
jgi:4-amino-4-deoxy-L-arabinose transferase-like glycosyltransferase